MHAVDRRGQAVALERIQRQPQADEFRQRRALQPGRQHDPAGRQFALVGAQRDDAFALDDETGRMRLQPSLEIRMPREALTQLDAERVAIGHGLARGEDAAREPVRAAIAQRGFDGEAFVPGQRAFRSARRARGHAGEFLGLPVDDQLAGRAQLDGVEGRVALQLAEALLAEGAQFEQALGGALVDRTAAVGEEGGQPAPLRGGAIGLEAQRAVGVQQPTQRLQRHAGIGQRRHVAVAELPAVRPARAGGERGLALHQRHPVPRLRQGPGGGDANDAATDHHELLHPGRIHS